MPQRSTDTEMPDPSTTHTARDCPSTVASAASRVPQIALIAVLGTLLVATPAPAHTIEVRRATDAVRAAAGTLGEVDRARCWRPVIDARRARHRAVCVAWWVHTPASESCTVFYEVRLAPHPSRRLTVVQTYVPWCASEPDGAEWR
jgi:hypothetical protein